MIDGSSSPSQEATEKMHFHTYGQAPTMGIDDGSWDYWYKDSFALPESQHSNDCGPTRWLSSKYILWNPLIETSHERNITMDTIEEEPAYEEKMDEITIQLEELILDAMITVLEKTWERNREFNRMAQGKNDHIPFWISTWLA